MIRLDVVHIKLPQVIQLHTSMITEYSTVQYTTGTVLYCCHSVCLYLSVMLFQHLFQTLFRYGQVLLCSIIMIHYRSRFTFVRQTFLRIRLSSKSFWFIKQHLLDTLGPPVHVLEMYMYCLICNTFRMRVSLDTFVVIIALTKSNSLKAIFMMFYTL